MMSFLVAAMLIACNPPAYAEGRAEGLERPVTQVADLPGVNARDAVFDRAGILPHLQGRDDLERDILYFHASREPVDRLMAGYDWLDRPMAEALKREVALEQRRPPEAGTDGGRGIAPPQSGEVDCRDAIGRRPAPGTSIEDLLPGSWARDCASDDAIAYLPNRTLEGGRRAGRWRIDGDVLTEIYVIRADPADSTDTDMSFTRRSRVVIRDDDTLSIHGLSLSGGDVPADIVLQRCD